MAREAYLYEKRPGGGVRCLLCSHRCVIGEGRRGICGVRECRDGRLLTLVFDRVVSLGVDPVEKKPLFHFLPGTPSLSLAAVGCNFRCEFCQNFSISQLPRAGGPIPGEPVTPGELAALAASRGCPSISYTYTEPTVFYELTRETGLLARAKGLRNIYVTNGYMSPEAVHEMKDFLDAANVDLKSFSDEFYRHYCGARLEPVLASIRALHRAGVWLEITTLVIPGRNSDPDGTAPDRRVHRLGGSPHPVARVGVPPGLPDDRRPADLRRPAGAGLRPGRRRGPAVRVLRQRPGTPGGKHPLPGLPPGPGGAGRLPGGAERAAPAGMPPLPRAGRHRPGLTTSYAEKSRMTESRISMVLGTAGHIDHGKTTLLQALTGVNADRLKEEQERGITIDIGFAPWVEPPYAIGFVDVPGHERFIKNMLAGAGGIDGVLLVVAADEGVMPQTREHFEIVSLLGIRHGVIALTKCDAVEPEYAELVEDDVRRLVAGSFLEPAEVVRTSAVTGQGLGELKQAIRRLADRMVDRDAAGVPRLFVDRVFVARGFGAVVTGTTLGGIFRRNDGVAVLPAGRPAKIRFIQVYGQEREEARPGERTAMNLAGVEPAELARGMVVAPAGAFTPSSIVNAEFHLLKSFGKPLRDLLPAHIYHGSAELLGRIQLLESDRLEPGTTALVQVRLESPSLLWPGDHFVVRQYSPLVTMGGGRVLENHAARFRKKEAEAVVPRLRRLVRSGTGGDSSSSGWRPKPWADCARPSWWTGSGLSPQCVRRILEQAAAQGTAHRVAAEPGAWMADAAWRNLAAAGPPVAGRLLCRQPVLARHEKNGAPERPRPDPGRGVRLPGPAAAGRVPAGPWPTSGSPCRGARAAWTRPCRGRSTGRWRPSSAPAWKACPGAICPPASSARAGRTPP